MDAAERALLAETVGAAMTGAGDSATSVDAVLADLGWLDMLAAEEDDAIAIVFAALGGTNRNATALDDVVAHRLGTTAGNDTAVLLPPFADWAPPGRVEGAAARAGGIATARVTTATELLVVCTSNGELCTVTVPMTAADVTNVSGIDPHAGLHVVRVDSPAPANVMLDATAWRAAVALSQRALAHQIAGASRAMLALAREHALERVQFGRPIARFQAVRHRLADALVAIEALDAALTAATAEPVPETAALAKAVAGRCARVVAANCQQVLAGVGFTTDHPFHRYLKRTVVLDGLFGSSDEIVVDIGRRLLTTRKVPALIEL